MDVPARGAEPGKRCHCDAVLEGDGANLEGFEEGGVGGHAEPNERGVLREEGGKKEELTKRDAKKNSGKSGGDIRELSLRRADKSDTRAEQIGGKKLESFVCSSALAGSCCWGCEQRGGGKRSLQARRCEVGASSRSNGWQTFASIARNA